MGKARIDPLTMVVIDSMVDAGGGAGMRDRSVGEEKEDGEGKEKEDGEGKEKLSACLNTSASRSRLPTAGKARKSGLRNPGDLEFGQ